MAIPRGATVRQIVPKAIEGKVAGYSLDQITGERQLLVEWPDPDGGDHVHSAYMREDAVEVIAPPPAEAAAPAAAGDSSGATV